MFSLLCLRPFLLLSSFFLVLWPKHQIRPSTRIDESKKSFLCWKSHYSIILGYFLCLRYHLSNPSINISTLAWDLMRKAALEILHCTYFSKLLIKIINIWTVCRAQSSVLKCGPLFLPFVSISSYNYYKRTHHHSQFAMLCLKWNNNVYVKLKCKTFLKSSWKVTNNMFTSNHTFCLKESW